MSEEIETLVRRVVAEEMRRFPIIINVHEPLNQEQLTDITRVLETVFEHKTVVLAEPLQASRTTAKHDGKLLAGSELSQDGEVYWAGDFLALRWEHSVVCLDASQALSLLAWLEQERETLERMAKEQTS